MYEVLSFLGPVVLLLAVVGGHLATIFEPYYAQRTQEGIELMEYHAQDLKLRLIAEWWSAKLVALPGGWYDDESEQARQLFGELHQSLVRHRFLSGDDPAHLSFGLTGTSPILREAQQKLGVFVHGNTEGTKMLIGANKVEIEGGRVIWRGKPQEYKSRFCDMYYDSKASPW